MDRQTPQTSAAAEEQLAAVVRRLDAEAPPDAPPRLVVALGGVGKLDLCTPSLRRVLRAAGCSCLFHAFHWSRGLGRWYADLRDAGHHEAQAARLARLISLFRDRRPAAVVSIVAKSGGCGVAVGALERLPPSAVERAVLLAPALSPGYDLTAALRAVSREMVVFWSPLDLIVLGLGTCLFGTMDRVHSAGAGLKGFRPPPDANANANAGAGANANANAETAAAYARLRQVRWRPRMAAAGNLGGHVGPDSPVFLKKYVLPLLRAEPRGKG